jgi:hypothetical protein
MRYFAALASLCALSAALAAPALAADDNDPLKQLGLIGLKLSPDQLGLNSGLLAGLAALLKALPPGNTVSIQIGEGPAQTLSGAGPQALAVTSGNVTASASAGPSGASVSASMSTGTNAMSLNASAGTGSAAASVNSGL